MKPYCTNVRLRIYCLAALALLFSAYVLFSVDSIKAQEHRIPLVESLGVATEFVTPSHVEFWMHRETSGESMQEALNTADSFGSDLRRHLSENDANPLTFEVSAPTVVDLFSNTVLTSVMLRYSASSYQHPDTGLRNFARLCEKIVAAANAFNSDIVGPLMHVQNKESAVEKAVSQAVANAFMAADAVAGSMRATVYAVDTVQIMDITWNETPGSQAVEPTLRQASCTARVRVVYSLSDQQQ